MHNITILFYIANATLLLLHEIESGYEKEWEILKLPGKLTGFLLLHIPVIVLLFYGLIELYKGSTAGIVLGVVSGAGGFLPFVIHKLLVRRQGHFNHPISDIIIYTNMFTGAGAILFSLIGR